jgi:hypothetical protein
MKTGALIRFPLRPHAACAAMDDALDDGKAEPRSREILSPVQPPKNTEQLFIVYHIQSDIVIFDVVLDFVSPGAASHFNLCRFPEFREFGGIGKQIEAPLLNERLVSAGGP